MCFELNIKPWIEDIKFHSESREGTEICPEDSVSAAGSLRSCNSTTLVEEN